MTIKLASRFMARHVRFATAGVCPVDWEHGVEATTASPRCPGPKHNAAWIQKLTGLFEIHYTTTLNDAKISEIPLFFNTNTFSGFGLDSIDVGNEANRIDVLNVVTGLSANVGKWVVTNGVSAPVRKGADRGFDFEYNLQLQRPF